MRQDDASTSTQEVHSSSRWSRRDVAEAVTAIRQQGLSLREAASHLGIARSTLQGWQSRQRAMNASEATIAYFESPDGLDMLQRLLLALHLLFVLCNSIGIRVICEFLQLTGLSDFVASSYGSQQRLASAIESAVVEYGNAEQQRLAKEMEQKQITLCVDETFHERMCLVAIEPVSNYILLESYADARDAATWQTHVTSAIEEMPVEVLQVTSDEAAGLLAMTRDGFDAVHSPDLFHIQQELSRGTRLPLESQVTAAQKALDKAQAATKQVERQKQEYDAAPRGPGRSPDFDKRLSDAKQAEEQAEAELEQCVCRQVDAREAIEGIGQAYHPIDLQTGNLLDGRSVHNKLRALFDRIDDIAQESGLSEKATKHLAKARRLLPTMVLVIGWAVRTMRRWVDDLALSEAAQRVVLDLLIPGLYLQAAAGKVRDTQQRKQLQSKSQQLLEQARARDGPLAQLPEADRQTVERVAADCATLFQRSSSCVEGRNGQLSLRRHHLHRLQDGRLAALTVLHNFWGERNDGTTAAQRFFGNPPKDLLAHLLSVIDMPPRPQKIAQNT